MTRTSERVLAPAQSSGESDRATGENGLEGLPGVCLGVRGRAGKLVWSVVYFVLFGGGQLRACKWKPETWT
jgi:hypothetical protein